MKTLTTLLLSLLILTVACSQQVQLDIQPEGVLFSENSDTILFYQTAEKSQNGAYPRANYIHPLHTLDGAILTEDFPKDHPHNRGIFWAWHQLYVGDQRIGDGWEIKDFQWEVQTVKELSRKDCAKSIQATVVWKSSLWIDNAGNNNPLVLEKTTITAHPLEDHYRRVDVTISILALEPDMRIGGSEDAKGYGGFSPRIRLTDDVAFSGPDGLVEPENLPIEAGGWMDISGSLGKGGSLAGLTIMSHPSNPDYPNPWILRAKSSMQNAVFPHPGSEAVPLSDTEPTVLRYRLVIHSGLEMEEIAELNSLYQ